MVTLITEQLRKQSLEEPYHKAFNVNVTLPALGSSPTISWSACKSTQESSIATQPLLKAKPLDASCALDSTLPYLVAKPHHGPEASITLQSSPPPPPPKRHCRSLSVPEDLSQCRSTWHPSASKVWTPVKRASQSIGTSQLGLVASSLPPCGPRTFYKSSSLHSSSSPPFFSLALSADSPLSWNFPWDPRDSPKTACSSFATPSSCSSSPTPLVGPSVLHRRYSLSPLQVLNTSVLSHHPQLAHTCALTHGYSSMECPALSPSPTSACSTPSSSRRGLHRALPRCHSQPCDMRKPRLKRRHDPDVLPGPRPGLNFSKMTQIGNGEALFSGCMTPVHSQIEQNSAPSPVEFLGRVSIRPRSESEEEDEDDKMKRTVTPEAHLLFERDCTELDLNLIEEN
ncbi:protein FAM53C-like [Corythoichthys intestinalis]|uniref:protein FAM53C-like n=1 Tax=Corythoichthys intestinalis TaxID=161448 RepID=UPI0025A4F9EB|nr:protein FAM53C-like [Corythoichthys intestinalis]XP_061792595.1 protein FAM53C-like [Nerophis lumbriciformis]